MPSIPLTQGRCALIDEVDFERVNQFKWSALHTRNTWYAVRSIHGHPPGRTASGRLKKTMVYMHREILGVAESMLVDHIDRNGLNNVRSNIRAAGYSDNNANHKLRSDNRSGYTGVFWHGHVSAWWAYVNVKGTRHTAGYFATAMEAARARDALARVLHGEFARLNFPDHP